MRLVPLLFLNIRRNKGCAIAKYMLFHKWYSKLTALQNEKKVLIVSQVTPPGNSIPASHSIELTSFLSISRTVVHNALHERQRTSSCLYPESEHRWNWINTPISLDTPPPYQAFLFMSWLHYSRISLQHIQTLYRPKLFSLMIFCKKPIVFGSCGQTGNQSKENLPDRSCVTRQPYLRDILNVIAIGFSHPDYANPVLQLDHILPLCIDGRRQYDVDHIYIRIISEAYSQKFIIL